MWSLLIIDQVLSSSSPQAKHDGFLPPPKFIKLFASIKCPMVKLRIFFNAVNLTSQLSHTDSFLLSLIFYLYDTMYYELSCLRKAGLSCLVKQLGRNCASNVVSSLIFDLCQVDENLKAAMLNLEVNAIEVNGVYFYISIKPEFQQPSIYVHVP